MLQPCDRFESVSTLNTNEDLVKLLIINIDKQNRCAAKIDAIRKYLEEGNKQ